MVENFEKEFAAFCQTERAVAVNSGTDALRFALMAAGVKRATWWSRFRTPSSRRPKRFRRRERCPSSSTSTSAPTTWIRKNCAISGDAVHACGGRQAHQQAQRASGNGDCPSPSLWPDGGHGRDSGTGEAISPGGGGGRVPGARGGIFLAQTESLVSRRIDGARGAFSFYPGKNLGACGEGGAITTNDANSPTPAK
jgi:hypothetical protein